MTFNELQVEWTDEKVTDYLYQRQRYLFSFYSKKFKEIEQTNREAREKGVSYKDRQRYGRQLDALKKLLAETDARGKYYGYLLKTKSYVARASWLSEDDMHDVNTHGIELTLNIKNVLYPITI